MDSRAYIFGDLRIGNLSTNVEEVEIYLGQQTSVGWEGGCQIPETSCKVREDSGSMFRGEGGGVPGPIFICWRDIPGPIW